MRITSILKRLAGHCAAYRISVDRIFLDDLSAPNRLQCICRQIQVGASELQVDRHLILDWISKTRLSSNVVPVFNPKQHDVHREMELRSRLKERLEGLSVWNQFRSQNLLAESAGLHSVSDYIQTLQ